MLVDAGWQTRTETGYYFLQRKVKDEGYKNLATCVRSLMQVIGKLWDFAGRQENRLKNCNPSYF